MCGKFEEEKSLLRLRDLKRLEVKRLGSMKHQGRSD